jgi:hypothetical protein
VTNHNDHIDRIIREKFDSFEPTPPPRVWQGVLSGMETQQRAKANRIKRTFVLAAAFLVILLSWVFLIPEKKTIFKSTDSVEYTSIEAPENPVHEPATSNDLIAKESQPSINQKPVVIQPAKTVGPSQSKNEIVVGNNPAAFKEPENPDPIGNDTEKQINDMENRVFLGISYLNFRGLNQVNQTMYEPFFYSFHQSQNVEKGGDKNLGPVKNALSIKPRKWSSFVGVSPEFVTTTFDSVTLLNTYSINYEPIFHLNKSFFLRFGFGVSYAKDRGFAKLDYISNDLMGTYHDVYDVTFDSINGQVVPTYYTKTVEVWDSIRHLVISEVTNRYIYVQVPVLLGYFHQGNHSSFNWYLYGGPAMNIQVGKFIDKPHPAEKDVEIINLQNKLPVRNNTYFQLWLGAGIEYKLSNQFSMAIEPGYRYYIHSIYNKPGYNKPLSAFTLRIGAIIRLN